VDDGKLVSFKRGVHCAGGDTKNRSKECRIDLVVDRISTATVRANELPLWFAANKLRHQDSTSGMSLPLHRRRLAR
jgi:hypothetical protein